MGRERIQDCPNFLGTSIPLIISGMELQIWLEHSQGPSDQKPIKNFSKRERVRACKDCPFFGNPNYLGDGQGYELVRFSA